MDLSCVSRKPTYACRLVSYELLLTSVSFCLRMLGDFEIGDERSMNFRWSKTTILKNVFFGATHKFLIMMIYLKQNDAITMI